MNAEPPLGTDPVTLETLAAAPCWVAWQAEERGNDVTKVPYIAVDRRAQANRGPWLTRDAAEKVAADLPKPHGIGGVGIEFFASDDGRALGGIDLDACRRPGTGAMEDWALEIVERLDSYTEISPSGTGAKVFFTYVDADLAALQDAMGTKWGKQFKRGGGKHPPAIELHLGNRYFAVTDQIVSGMPQKFRLVEAATLLDIVQRVGPDFAGKANSKAGTPDTEKPEADNPPPDHDDDNPELLARINAACGLDPWLAKRWAGDWSGIRDLSGSGKAFTLAAALKRAGFNFEDTVAALNLHLETKEWTQTKGETNRRRELHRLWARIEARPSESPGDDNEINKPTVRIAAGGLDIATTEGEAAIIAAGKPVYQRGNALVQPIVRDVAASHGRTTKAAGLGEQNAYAIFDLLSETAEWERFDGRANNWVRTDPPMLVARILLARQGQWRFRPIAGVITSPTLRPDGTLLVEPGYDPATRLYHVLDRTLDLRPELQRPTRQLAERALSFISALLAEFPFVVTEDQSGRKRHIARAVALSGIITPIVRGALSVVPLHAFRATAPGSGKSYLADIISTIATGRPCPVISAAKDEAETEKRIAGLLLAGYPIVSIDNVNGELGSDLLCQAIERPLIRIRPLGSSEIIEIENRASLYATGNQMRVRGDAVRRTLVSDLDANEERPELRAFKADPVAMILANRGHYVSACLMIVRAYMAEGQPRPLTPIASFADWSDLVRSALVWLGSDDPAQSMEAARADDPELTELREMLAVWAAALGFGGITAAEAAKQASLRTLNDKGEPTGFQHPELRDVLIRSFGERGNISTRRLARWLVSREGRKVEGHRFGRAGSAQGGVTRWAVQPVKPT